VGTVKEHEYSGHLHIHSSFSDGNASVEEIARHAASSGLTFIGITDHNTLEGLKKGLEGWHNGVLVFFGTEINVEKNHYIAFNIREKIPPDDENPQRVIDAVNARGGFGYLAHPVEKGNPFFLKGRFFAWDKWDVSGFTGLEIWNFGSLWRAAYNSKIRVLFWYFYDIYRAARFPDPEGLAIWDSLLQERPVVAFAGSDAHSFQGRLGPFKLSFFPYGFLFRTLNTHILLEEELSRDLPGAREQIFSSLRKGRFFIGSDYLHSTRGFRFSALNKDDDEVSMGQEIAYSPATVLRIVSPSPRGLIRVIKNGRVVYESREQILAFKVLKPGTFRVEVCWRPFLGRPLPWIFSNPIYVRY
jgi:hypothetical protein